MSLELIFSGANLFVLPFWGLMLLVPRWNITRRIMSSYLPFVALALVYLYLFVVSLDPQTIETFSDPQLKLADLAQLFAQEKVTATGWVHFLVMDLFVGRWVYQRSLELNIWFRHSLLLCFFAGPLGLLCHFITETLSQKFWPQPEEAAAAESVSAGS
ncbi:ABA4-like family protein [Sphaerothrix gracilis]|uniref:ABA4-like family protein n=1 Tax=Sphaerothrix gracilis TaxID=3151835 RepID=UPI0031FC0650